MATNRDQTSTKASPAANAGAEAVLARPGKLSYLQIPASDVEASARFYATVFSWRLSGSSSHRSFTDASGELSGAFIPGREISRQAGLLPYIYVEGIDAALSRIAVAGGAIESAPRPEGTLWVATFRDPAGNLMGLWTAGPR